MSRLPKDWRERVVALKGKYTQAQLGDIFGIGANGVWMVRLENEEFENAILPHMMRGKRVYCAAPESQPLSEVRKGRAEARRNPTRKEKPPLLDEENLDLETRAAVLTITGMTRHDIGEMSLNEIRRWGAIMALSHEVILRLKKDLRAARSEAMREREKVHNMVSGRPLSIHATGGPAE